MLHLNHPVRNNITHTSTSHPSMKKFFLFIPAIILALILAIGFGTDFQDIIRNLIVQQPPVVTILPQTSDIIPNNVVRAMIGQVDQQIALNDLRKLTGVEQVCLDHGCYTITNRPTGSVGLQWAKDYVSERLVGMGYDVQVQDWSYGGYADQNLIIRKPGKLLPENEIYFVAHLDGVSNAPAADDNGSGVVSLLQLASAIKNRSFNNTLILLFSTGEEQGALGVHYYVNQLTQEQLQAISYVVDVDMIGYDSNDDGVMELWNGEQPLDFVKLLGEIISAYQLDLNAQVVSDCG